MPNLFIETLHGDKQVTENDINMKLVVENDQKTWIIETEDNTVEQKTNYYG